MTILFYMFCVLIRGCIWGFATNAVIANKNCDEDWFWWGFFFGIIALLVALSKPQNTITYVQEQIDSPMAQKMREKDILDDNGWRCRNCGTVNPNYTGSCGCGMTREENDRVDKPQEDPVDMSTEKQKADKVDQLDKFEQIKKYKELLDSEIITQEEFNQKKKELLNL